MPNCFTLTRKSDLEAGPVAFQVIDEELCKFFDVPCDPKTYLNYWYDCFGLRIACGQTFDQILTEFREIRDTALDGEYDYHNDILIGEYLAEHFTSDAWAEIGRR